jgi:hypothetical protein
MWNSGQPCSRASESALLQGSELVCGPSDSSLLKQLDLGTSRAAAMKCLSCLQTSLSGKNLDQISVEYEFDIDAVNCTFSGSGTVLLFHSRQPLPWPDNAHWKSFCVGDRRTSGFSPFRFALLIVC